MCKTGCRLTGVEVVYSNLAQVRIGNAPRNSRENILDNYVNPLLCFKPIVTFGNRHRLKKRRLLGALIDE